MIKEVVVRDNESIVGSNERIHHIPVYLLFALDVREKKWKTYINETVDLTRR